MLKDIVAVQPLEDYQIHLRFEDGIEGVVDVSQLIEFSGIFATSVES
jgi:ribosomal protein S1